MIWYIANEWYLGEDDGFKIVARGYPNPAYRPLCNECFMLIPKAPGDWNC